MFNSSTPHTYHLDRVFVQVRSFFPSDTRGCLLLSIKQKSGGSGPAFFLCCPLMSCFCVSQAFSLPPIAPSHGHHALGFWTIAGQSAPWWPQLGSGGGTGQLSPSWLCLFRVFSVLVKDRMGDTISPSCL